MDYVDLARLTDFDFELVCRDLFEDILGVPLEVFTRGPDGGVDVRYMADDGVSTIIQCKHWMRTGPAALLRYMRKTERAKIATLSPDRYILLTSVSLSVEMKDTLQDSLKPYVRVPGDIYGAEQLVEELRKRPDVVRRHFKLWLSGTAVLQSVLNKEILLRSSDLADEVQLLTRTFVPTSAYEAAVVRLAERSVCLIVGIPGIGKTATAMMLAAAYLADGYELVEVSRDVDEIDRAWQHDTKQFYYYDDFLGQTTLGDKLNKNEDKRLLNVIRRIQRSPDKKLVLTTREYILNQAFQRHERLDTADLRPLTLFLGVKNYSAVIKARMLYNLVYHSGVPAHEKRKFAELRSWHAIIDHDNFNPRLVERTLGTAGFGDHEFDDVAREMIANLDNPERIWRHIVEYELDDAAVHLLEVLFTFGVAAPEPQLQRAWEHYRTAQGVSADLRSYHRNRRLLEGTMTRTVTENVLFDLQPEDTSVLFHNPSIRDYMLTRITNGLTPLVALVESIQLAGQLCALLASAIGVRGAELLAQLETCMDTLTAAIGRTMMEPHARQPDIRIIVMHGLTVAIVTNSQQLAAQLIDNIGCIKLSKASIDDLAELAIHIEKCHLLLGGKVEYLEEILEEIVDRGRNWEDLGEVNFALERLPVAGADDYLQQLHDDMLDEATSILEPWVSGKPDDFDATEIEAVVEFIDDILGDWVPGIDEARDALDNQSSLGGNIRWVSSDDLQSSPDVPHPNVDSIEQLRLLLAEYQADTSGDMS